MNEPVDGLKLLRQPFPDTKSASYQKEQRRRISVMPRRRLIARFAVDGIIRRPFILIMLGMRR